MGVSFFQPRSYSLVVSGVGNELTLPFGPPGSRQSDDC